MKIAVIGAGSWGTALAQLLACNGNEVGLWARKPEVVEAVNASHANPRYLSEVELSPRIVATTSYEEALAGAQAAVIVTPSSVMRDVAGVLAEAGVVDTAAVNRLLNQEIKAATARGLKVLYCIGEKSEEQADWENVLGAQLDIGLDGVDKSRVVIAYEPIWSIGPGKTPADKPYITKIARFVKARTGGLDVVYGGGLKQDNAAMLASIDEIDGGLIALTRFSGEIGFYPDEYLDIIRRYLGK